MLNTFNIVGCCVLRDVFRICEDDKFKVEVFVQYCNPISAIDENQNQDILKLEDLNNFAHFSNFNKKCVLYDLNKNIFSTLKENPSDWFLMDMCELRRFVCKLTIDDKSFYATKNKYLDEVLKDCKVFNSKNIVVEENINFSEEEKEAFYKKYLAAIKEVYNEKQIILIKNYSVSKHYNEEEKIFEDLNPSSVNFICNEFEKAYEIVEKNMPNIHIIEMPDYALGFINHQWGADPLHFVDHYYKYLYECIQVIVSKEKNEKERLNQIKEHYSQIFELMYKTLSLNNYISKNNPQSLLKNTKIDNLCIYGNWKVELAEGSSFDEITKTLKSSNEQRCWAILSQKIDINNLIGKPITFSVKLRTENNSIVTMAIRGYKNKTYDYLVTKNFSANVMIVESITLDIKEEFKEYEYVDVAVYTSKPNASAIIEEVKLEEGRNSSLFLDIDTKIIPSKKVVYQVGHYGFLINALIHKQLYHKNDEAVFFVDKVIMNNMACNFLDKNKENFSKLGRIVLYNDMDIIKKSNSEQELENNIISYFDNLLENENIKLKNTYEIYSMFDTYNAFGVYLSIKQQPFNMLECLKDQCRTNRYNLSGVYNDYDKVIFKHKALTLDCPYCKKVWVYENKVYKDKPCKANCNISEMIKSLTSNEINDLIEVYKNEICYQKNIPYYSILMNSGWIINQLKLSYKHFFYLNQMVLDLYMDKSKKLLIKPHPNFDFPKEVWAEEFPNADVISGCVPSILLNYLDELNIEKSINLSITGADKTKENSINVPFNIYYTYQYIDKLYFALMLAKFMGVENNNFYHFGLYDDVIWHLENQIMGEDFKSQCSNFQFSENMFTIIDNINFKGEIEINKFNESLKNANENSVIVFLNSKGDFSFILDDESYLQYIMPLKITKRKTRHNSLESIEDEYIYIFCKNKDLLSKISNFECIKSGEFVGCDQMILPSQQDYEKNKQHLNKIINNS